MKYATEADRIVVLARQSFGDIDVVAVLRRRLQQQELLNPARDADDSRRATSRRPRRPRRARR
jgi:hypothetical protein